MSSGAAAPQTLKLAAKQRNSVTCRWRRAPPGRPTSWCASRVRRDLRSSADMRSTCGRRRKSSRAARSSRSPKAKASRCPTICSPISCRGPRALRCRSGSRLRSMRRRCSPRSIAIRSVLGADHEPGVAAPLCQRSRRARRILRWMRRSISASATPSIGCWRARARTARSGCGRPAGMTCGSTPMSTDFLTRARERGFAVPDTGVQACARSAAQFRRRTPRIRPRTAGAISPTHSMCWRRNGAAPIGDLRYLRRHQARCDCDSDRQGADRGGARHARRPRACRARLCGGARRRSRRSRCLTMAAPIMARRCATPRRW